MTLFLDSQLFIYRQFGSGDGVFNMSLLFLVGFFANGPYALITTAVSTDLGTHPQLKGSTRALATVKPNDCALRKFSFIMFTFILIQRLQL
jgi:OPA family glycerol-3-phosphate transporter-like MFS transporter 1/2